MKMAVVGATGATGGWSPARDIDVYFPSDTKSIQVNFGSNGHARAQLIQVPLIRIEAYPHWQPLNYLERSHRSHSRVGKGLIDLP
jgi:hypothetical protein